MLFFRKLISMWKQLSKGLSTLMKLIRLLRRFHILSEFDSGSQKKYKVLISVDYFCSLRI